MEFSSLDELIGYVENKFTHAKSGVKDTLVEETKKITRDQQDKYDPKTRTRTGDLIECINGTVTNDEIEIVWEDNGSWTSYNGNHFYAPIGLEMGKTYGTGGYRPKTEFVDETTKYINKSLRDELKKELSRNGVPSK